MNRSATSEEITLQDLVRILWSHRWLVLATTLVGGILGLAWAKSTRPTYSVDSLLQLEGKNAKSTPGAVGAMADLFQTSNPAETEIEIIRSRLVLARAASNLGMEIRAVPIGWGRIERLLDKPRPRIEVERFDVPVGRQGVVHILEIVSDSAYRILGEEDRVVLSGRAGTGIDSSSNPDRVGIMVRGFSAAPGQRFSILRRQAVQAAGELRQNLSIMEVGKKTGVIRLSLRGFDGERDAEVLDEIANSYVRQNVERMSAEAEKTLDFLQELLPELKKQVEGSEERLSAFRSSMGSIDLTEEGRLALKQQVDVQQELFAARQKRKEVLQFYNETHPNIKTIDSLIANLSSQSGLQGRQVRQLPLQQQEVVRLMRDVQVNTEMYTTLLNNAQQLRVVKAGEVGTVRIVDPAMPSRIPVGPDRRLHLIAGMGAGFLLGAAMGLLRRILSSGYPDAGAIEREFDVPVLAQIPHSGNQSMFRREIRRRLPGNHVLTVRHPDDPAIEGIRSLRTALEFSLAGKTTRVVVVTGPTEGIGKSFVSQNIAIVLAQAGRKVLLIDGDLRRGELHAAFGVPRGEGFADILAGRADLEDCRIRPIADSPLVLLTSGTLPANPAELVQSETTRGLLEEWSSRFDVVIVDAPPVLSVTDAALLAQPATATLLVLKANKHSAAEIETTLMRLRRSGVVPTGMVLNDVPNQPGFDRYSYDYTRRKT